MKVPERLRTISVLVALSQDLTSAVTLELPPVTISPAVKSPVPPTPNVNAIALEYIVSISSISAIPVLISSD